MTDLVDMDDIQAMRHFLRLGYMEQAREWAEEILRDGLYVDEIQDEARSILRKRMVADD